MPEHQLLYYQSAGGKQPFTEWLAGLADVQARARIQVRLNRLALGNFGDCESAGGGVLELRIDWGPGYRVYLARIGQAILLLLCGGDKTTQQKDIDRAKVYLEDYKTRATKLGEARKPAPRDRRP
jgi:putative addiction module killer protein